MWVRVQRYAAGVGWLETSALGAASFLVQRAEVNVSLGLFTTYLLVELGRFRERGEPPLRRLVAALRGRPPAPPLRGDLRSHRRSSAA